ncbi:hypothetical protein BC941DRAFT_472543 [Chlamydoabsidia padenii]|nr:hypothetical protein BC941DRAFT_472543 [Chlamydoabsidia padenii]
MKRPNKKIIAVELDQTLAPTLDTFVAWHNATYDTDLAISQIYYNNIRDMTRLFGGTKEEGCTKLREFYDSTEFNDMMPLKDETVDTFNGHGNKRRRRNSTVRANHGQQRQKQRWGALEVLQSLKKRKWTLVIVTYRPQFTQTATQRFIDRYYPGLFDGIYYCNQGLSVADQLDYIPKPITIMCQEIGADYLIDDTLDHCLDCSMLDMTLLLYDHHGKYTYNHMQPQKRPRSGRPTLTSTSKQLYQRSASRSVATLPDNVIRVKSWKDILDQFPMPTSPLRYCHYPTTSPASSATQPYTSASSRHAWNHDDQNGKEHSTDDDDDDDYQTSWNDCDAIAV